MLVLKVRGRFMKVEIGKIEDFLHAQMLFALTSKMV